MLASIMTPTLRVEKTVAALVLDKARSGVWSRGGGVNIIGDGADIIAVVDPV